MPTGRAIRAAIGRHLNRVLAPERVYQEVVNSGIIATSLTDAIRLLSTRLTAQSFQDWIVWRLGDKGTATATSATTLTDSGAAWGTAAYAPDSDYVGAYVRAGNSIAQIASHTATVLTLTAAGWAGGTPASDAEYEIFTGQVTYARQLTPSTGLLAVSKSFETILAVDDQLELWSPKLPHPFVIVEARDIALSQICLRGRLVPVTMAVDGDMLLTGDSNWTESSATDVKRQDTNIEKFAEQVLAVTNTGANGYSGQTINNPRGGPSGTGEAWFFFVLAQPQAAAGVAAFTVQDLTNAAALTLTANRSTWGGQAWQVMRGSFGPPASCEQISARMGGQGASDETWWANLCIYPQNATEFVLPARITTRKQVGQFYEMVGDDWPYTYPVALKDQPDIFDIGGGGVRVSFAGGVGNRAIFYEEFANYAALQTDYHTPSQCAQGDAAFTDCDLDYVKIATLDQLFPGQYADELAKLRGEKAPEPSIRWTKGYARA